MKLIDRIAALMGYRPAARPHGGSRQFQAAASGRLVADWSLRYLSADAAISADLATLRGRSRALRDDSDYMRRFLSLLRNNVVGWRGILMKPMVRLASPPAGAPLRDSDEDETANNLIAALWADWVKTRNCSVSGTQSLLAIQRMVLDTVPVDGEILIRKVWGFSNKWQLALQVLESDHLDHTYTADLGNGRRVVMGVEVDEWNRPSAYYLHKAHPGGLVGAERFVSGKWERIPASQIVHLFIRYRPEQTRGIPWIHTAGRRLHMLSTYEESELVASKVAASKMGFFTREAGLGGARYPDDDPDGDSPPEMEVAPGSFEELPSGLKLETWDPQHPNTNYAGYVKAILRGISAGLNISYHSLSSDLESVNFSSGRLGALDDRDTFRALQGWMIDEFLTGLFEDWLYLQLLNQNLPYGMEQYARLNAPSFRGRRWPYVDPKTEIDAATAAIQMGLTSRTRVLAEQGDAEFEEVAAELAREEALADRLGLSIGGGSPAPSAVPDDSATVADDEDEA